MIGTKIQITQPDWSIALTASNGVARVWNDFRLDIPGLPNSAGYDPTMTVVVRNPTTNTHQEILASLLVPTISKYTPAGIIANANTNPAFPASPTVWDAREITTTSGTVWWLAVTPMDLLVFGLSGWFVLQWDALQPATNIYNANGTLISDREVSWQNTRKMRFKDMVEFVSVAKYNRLFTDDTLWTWQSSEISLSPWFVAINALWTWPNDVQIELWANNYVWIWSIDSGYAGIRGATYYWANYDNNTYVQKQYVDDNLALLPTIYTADGSLTSSRNVSMWTNSLSFTWDGTFWASQTDGTNSWTMTVTSSWVNLASFNSISNNRSQFTQVPNFARIEHRFGSPANNIELNFNGITGILLTDNIFSRWLDWQAYYWANYTPTTYVQKQYVDSLIPTPTTIVDHENKVITTTNTIPNLLNTPVSGSVKLYIKWVQYIEGVHFTRVWTALTWTFTLAGGGFDILPWFFTSAQYRY